MRFALIISFLILTSNLKAQNWELIWSDEFNGNSLNSNNWTHEVGTGNWGWGNGELQYYQSDNSTVSNGKLTIEAREEPQGLNFLQAANFALLFLHAELGSSVLVTAGAA